MNLELLALFQEEVLFRILLHIDTCTAVTLLRTCKTLMRRYTPQLAEVLRLGLREKRFLTRTEYAAYCGDLPSLWWLRQYDPTAMLTKRVMACAAEKGHINVVIWLQRNNCEYSELAPLLAIANGHVEILRLLCENRTVDIPHALIQAAMCRGHIGVLNWLFVHDVRQFNRWDVQHIKLLGMETWATIYGKRYKVLVTHDIECEQIAYEEFFE